MFVKTPSGGIDARDGTTISSAACTICIAAETATPGELLFHETDEEVLVYNVEARPCAPDSYFKTGITVKGTRYALEVADVYLGKLDADLLYNDTTGVAVSIWTGHPLADSTRNITAVLPPPFLTIGQLDSGSWVKVEFINNRWYVTGAPCE